MGESQSEGAEPGGGEPAPGGPSARPWGLAGLGAVVVGGVLCVLGWYGVSGEAEVARQLPYLASATVPGAALIVAGAVLLGSRGGRPREVVAQLEGGDTPSAGDGASGEPAGVDGGTLYHRAGCPLVAGKPGVRAVTVEGRTACPVCLPDGGEAG